MFLFAKGANTAVLLFVISSATVLKDLVVKGPITTCEFCTPALEVIFLMSPSLS